jgi:hypothetical protein
MVMEDKNKISPHCRATRSHRIISDEFAVCQTDDPLCRHLVILGKHHLCFHPRREKILAQTPAAPHPLPNQPEQGAA